MEVATKREAAGCEFVILDAKSYISQNNETRKKVQGLHGSIYE